MPDRVAAFDALLAVVETGLAALKTKYPWAMQDMLPFVPYGEELPIEAFTDPWADEW